jgi:hypothetical protein
MCRYIIISPNHTSKWYGISKLFGIIITLIFSKLEPCIINEIKN